MKNGESYEVHRLLKSIHFRRGSAERRLFFYSSKIFFYSESAFLRFSRRSFKTMYAPKIPQRPAISSAINFIGMIKGRSSTKTVRHRLALKDASAFGTDFPFAERIFFCAEILKFIRANTKIQITIPERQTIKLMFIKKMYHKSEFKKIKPMFMQQGLLRRCRSESNRCLVVLQTSPLPLGYDTLSGFYAISLFKACQ